MIWRRAILWARCRKLNWFLRGTTRAHQVQRRILLEKIRRNAESDFGRQYGFAEIRSLEDFRRRLPISTYEDYRTYVERVKQGEISAMFGPGTRVLMFTMTSGTTAESKYIPITGQFLAEYRRGWNLWGTGAYRDHKELIYQLNLQMFSDWKKFYTPGGIPCGSISGLAAEMVPRPARVVFINSRPLMKISDPFAKHYAALRISAAKNVGIVITANPSTLIESARMADRRKETLIRDLYDGTLSKDFDVPDEVRHKLRWRLRPQRRKARRLEQIAEQNGTFYPRDFWPNMRVVCVWTGGSVGAYLPQMRQYFGNVAVRDHGLSASEGRITIPLEDETSAGVLDYSSQFFEFIPEDEHGSDNPTMLEAHELQEGRNYFVILTTSSGFYRYDIHDLVQCVGYHGQAPMLKFLSKGSHFSSQTGEKLSEYQAAMAVKLAFEELGHDFGHFTVAPVWGDPPGYVLLIEPGPYLEQAEKLAALIDKHLGELNMEYADRLETRRLSPLRVKAIAPGTWQAFRREKINSGGSMEQYKHPCLANSVDFLERIGKLAPIEARSASE